MRTDAKLTPRELEVAEFIAWGATKKEIARELIISVRTVENITRSIFEKADVTKANELSAWWFCTRFHISFELSPMKRSVMAFILLLIILPKEFSLERSDVVRGARKSTSQTVRSGRGGRRGREIDFTHI